MSGSRVAGLTLAELAGLGSGDGFWRTKAIGAHPAIEVADGPHGVRSQIASADQPGIALAPPATCFPPAVALAQTWDPELVERVGAAIGREARHLGVDVVLGPGINIKRDPRCGRNFEYYSEDPLLTGALGAAWVRGVQSQGVGTSLKHFAVNNQEHDRMSVSADVDERPLREIYLRAFERVVRAAAPTTVMCSYNRVNGVLASQNRVLLTDILRDEWGFEGVVVSDWGAVHDRVASVEAGLDLEMPGTNGVTDAYLVRAVEDGRLDPAVVERAADRVAGLVERLRVARESTPVDAPDLDAHHELAREAARRAITLLANRDGVLPLARGGRLAVIGELARTPRVQGGGSSRVNATRVDEPLDRIAAIGEAEVVWAPGARRGADVAESDRLAAEAAELASECDAAIVVIGLDELDEVEGLDRAHIGLRAELESLVELVAGRQPRTVAVLVHGGVVDLGRVADAAPAIVDAALTGQASAGALAEVLFGVANPSGRLAETVPMRLADSPAVTAFPGEEGHVRYGEGVFVGYRWYDARDLAVRFPFGHGLSYTEFRYGAAAAAAVDGGIEVAVEVTNVGDRAGREVVQVYASRPQSRLARPPRELVGFSVVNLEPGGSHVVRVTVPLAELAAWSVSRSRWWVEGGRLELAVGASSRDIRTIASIDLDDDGGRLRLTPESRLSDVLAVPSAAARLAAKVDWLVDDGAADAVGVGMPVLMGSLPVSRLEAFTGGALTRAEILDILAEANAASD